MVIDLGMERFEAVDAVVAAEASPVALALTTLSGEILYVNRAFQALFEAPDLAGRPGAGLYELNARYFAPERLSRLAKTGTSEQFMLRVRRAQGESSWWCHARREGGEAGVPKWLVFTFTELSAEALGRTASAPLERAMSEAERFDRFGTWTMLIGNAAQASLGDMYWSPGLSDLLNQTHLEQPRPATEWFDSIHREDRPAVIDALKRLIVDGRTYTIEYRLADRSGRTFCSRGQVLPPEAGAKLSISGIERDVTEAVRRDRQQREQLCLQRALAECYELPAFAVDRQLRLQWFNPLFAALIRELWGYGPEVDTAIAQIFQPAGEGRRIVQTLRQSLLGKRRVAELALTTPDGDRRRYDVTYNPIQDPAGEILGVVAVAAGMAAKGVMDRRAGRRKSASSLTPAGKPRRAR
jgi:PAS domain-containing protein